MHGHPGPVERKIRLWIVQQERARRKERQLGRAAARGEAPVARPRGAVNIGERGPWQ
ncbi:MAG TPA: hypothetical protein VNY52_09210 [Solirubrobacteraceae bacterium]|jgi:hypothetical protein|nr:hypothetical protein [Solirubrobacteraceae bacterium]